MASHKLTTYIAKNPPDAVRFLSSLSFLSHPSFHHRKGNLKQQQMPKNPKAKANQKVKRTKQVVITKIQTKEVLPNTM